MECTLCNYTAKTKGNYQKHCKTGKHIIKEQELKSVGKRNSPQKIIEQLQEELERNNESYKIRIEYITEKHKEELREKNSTIRAYQNGVITSYYALHKKLVELEYIDHHDNILITDVYNENKAMKAYIKQMEEQLIKTIDISGNYVIGRKLI